jgi:uncharacterized cupredoxin-like copper-binding protein
MILSLQRLLTGTFVAGLLLSGGVHVALASPGEHGYAFGAPGEAAQVDRTIRVTARDTEFDVPHLHIHAGETIRFIVINTGDLDHDFTIGPADLQAQHRREMTEMMEMMDGGDGMAAMHQEPNAVYLKPGETRELIWRFTKTRSLEFACNVPGHYESGMKGGIAPDAGHKPGS